MGTPNCSRDPVTPRVRAISSCTSVLTLAVAVSISGHCSALRPSLTPFLFFFSCHRAQLQLRLTGPTVTHLKSPNSDSPTTGGKGDWLSDTSLKQPFKFSGEINNQAAHPLLPSHFSSHRRAEIPDFGSKGSALLLEVRLDGASAWF